MITNEHTVKELSIFVNNKKGKLQDALNCLSGVNIRALSIADTLKFGIIRCIVSDNEIAIKTLEDNHFLVKENEVAAIIIDDKPNSLNNILNIFTEKDIDIEYAYAFSNNKTNEAIVIICFSDMELAKDLIKKENIKVLTKEYIDENF